MRGRFFVGGLILFAAVIAWFTAMWLSPYSPENSVEGTDHLREGVITFVRNGAIGTLILSALAGWLLFPRRRPDNQRRDWLLGSVIGLLVLSSLYNLAWLYLGVLR